VGFLTWKKDLKDIKIIKSSGCVYASSLNESNLIKKLKKINIDLSCFKINIEKHFNTDKNRTISILSETK